MQTEVFPTKNLLDAEAERINSAKPSESKLNMDKLTLFNNLKTYDFEEEDICKIIKILKDRKSSSLLSVQKQKKAS